MRQPHRPNGAYPRGRGGTSNCDFVMPNLIGLSPRARGNLVRRGLMAHSLRPIPAGAGEPRCHPACSGRGGAYPRGRGGTPVPGPPNTHFCGLSPRARGNRTMTEHRLVQEGPIPAGAGEPRSQRKESLHSKAYPRGRGGTAVRQWLEKNGHGLSPRARGNLCHYPPAREGRWPIPAGAGEPAHRAPQPRDSWAYPRGRGGTHG